MAIKVEAEIERDFYAMLKKHNFANLLRGSIYRKDMRPPKSREEDAVVSFFAGYDSQVQTGYITIDVYVPRKNQKIDLERITDLEIELNKFIHETDLGEYRVEDGSSMRTYYNEDLNQDFIVSRIPFKRYTG